MANLKVIRPNLLNVWIYNKSAFGYVVLLSGRELSWKNVKQFVVTAFIMKVEFVTCFEVTIQNNWSRKFIIGFGIVNRIVRPNVL